MNSMELVPFALEVQGNDYVRRCNVRRFNEDKLIGQVELWFQFDKSISPPENDDCDAYLLAMYMDAMQEGRNIIVKGSVSKELLSNLIEYQFAWNRWLPNTYSLIDINVDSVRTSDVAVSGAICAFSGGVDATFSVWRHSQNRVSYRSQEIKLCSLVHGLDIPLSDVTAFENALMRSVTVLNDIDIKMVPIKTNYKAISVASWEHVHACVIIATLSNFKKMVGTCVLGSGQPYDSFEIPWGSSPITDHLLSSDGFKVIHDGASHSRTEKVKEIADWQVGVDNLRVCWQGDLKDRNCGKCEKCLRTQLNFLATGNPIPNCFPDYTVGANISLNKVKLKKRLASPEWQSIYDFAKKNNVQGVWVEKLPRIFKRIPFNERVLPLHSSRREMVKKLSKQLGLR